MDKKHNDVDVVKGIPGYEIDDLPEFVNGWENPDSKEGSSRERPSSHRISSHKDSEVLPLNLTNDHTMSLVRRTYSDGEKMNKSNDEEETMIKYDMSYSSDEGIEPVHTLSFLTIKLNPGVSIKNIIALFIAFFVMNMNLSL